jgi:hypothetical protein
MNDLRACAHPRDAFAAAMHIDLGHHCDMCDLSHARERDQAAEIEKAWDAVRELGRLADDRRVETDRYRRINRSLWALVSLCAGIALLAVWSAR